jgi:hypothetical protein
LQVDKELVEPVIREQIQAAIVRELVNTESLVKNIVAEALRRKVASDGRQSSYDYQNEYTYLEWLVQDVIGKAAKEAIREYVVSIHDEVKVEVAKQIRSKANDFAVVLTDGLAAALESEWTFKVNVGFNSTEKDNH